MKSTTSLAASAIGALALAWVWGPGMAVAAERPIGGVIPGSEYIPSCPPGQQQGGKRFCVSEQKEKQEDYREALATCESRDARVCSSQDLIELHIETELGDQYDPNGAWLGDLRADGAACGVGSIDGQIEVVDFVGTCDEDEPRSFWCCSDL